MEGLVASWCIFIPIATIFGHMNTATTKELGFKKLTFDLRRSYTPGFSLGSCVCERLTSRKNIFLDIPGHWVPFTSITG